jgi:hypothetical protein
MLSLVAGSAAAAPFPRYDHVFLVIFENHGYGQIAGNAAAPTFNRLAKRYGLATSYFSVTDPSAPNYVAMLGGNFFGIADDNAYYTRTVAKPSLISQLDAAGLSWKGYYQGMPYPAFAGICYPNRCNGIPDIDPVYAAKHNGILYFKSVQDSAADRERMVPFEELTLDLGNEPPAFSYVIPDMCHDMHGAPVYCIDSGNPGDVDDNRLVAEGDRFLDELVHEITRAPFWSRGNNAIIVTFDQGADGDTRGCCDAVPGTGQVFTVVITSHGPRGLGDNTPYNHYSLLQTLQRTFGLGCLEFTCDTAAVTPMAPLFQIKP